MTRTKTIREENEEIERVILSPHACFSDSTRGRRRREPKCDLRTEFQRDRDRIIHSKSFRRLRYKTQVFLAPLGDHYRTRLTHTLEVSQISRVIARSLKLNEDLTEAIALGHDLGHTPFGHAGETVLNRLLASGFRHNEQSLRVVDAIEKDGAGLNLTMEVRNGILSHSKGKGPLRKEKGACIPVTKEGETVRLADLIAYLSHDLDDALRARVVRSEGIPRNVSRMLGNSHSARINSMVKDVIVFSRNADLELISFSERTEKAVLDLRDYMYENVYEAHSVHAEFFKAENILEQLFVFFNNNKELFISESGDPRRCPLPAKVADFISGMTDRYALHLYEKYFLPRPWEVL